MDKKIEYMIDRIRMRVVESKKLQSRMKAELLDFIYSGRVRVWPGKGRIDCERLDAIHVRKDHTIYLCRIEEVTLLHELVHAIGGKERDAEEAERILYPRTATPPTEDDYKKYDSEGRTFPSGEDNE